MPVKINSLKGYVLFLCFLLVSITSCKKTADIPPAMVAEMLKINESSGSVLIGGNFNYTLKFFNDLGQMIPLPSGIIWSTSNNAIATINQQGVATGVSSGQVEIRATYNNIIGTSLLNVVANNNQLAIVTLIPADILEIKLNQTASVMTVGKNINGDIINGLSYNWQTDNAALVEINNQGTVTGKAYGTANITATSMGIQSAQLMVQVIRFGNFSGSSSAGMGKLKIENGILKLQTSADFRVSNAPDLRIYLGNNSSNVNGAIEIATLTQKSGAQSWNIPAGTNITQYRYVIVWCKQFGGTYGVADLGQ